MRKAYGYDRPASDFDGLDLDQAPYIDTETTDRVERANLLGGTSLRKGDVLVMRDVSEIGSGGEIASIRAALASKGVDIEEIPLEREPARRGRPLKFDPTSDQDKQIEALYRSYLQMSHILDRVEEIMGHKVARHQLVHRYGKRWETDH